MESRSVFEEDFEEIKKWFERRGMHCPEIDLFSKNGLIVDDVAAGFLYSTDSGVCFLENFITNPDSNKKERLMALDLIAQDLCSLAEDLGFKLIFGFSTYPGIVKLAHSLYFNSLESGSYFVKEL